MRVNTGKIVIWDDAKEALDKTSIKDALAKHRRANPGTDTDLRGTTRSSESPTASTLDMLPGTANASVSSPTMRPIHCRRTYICARSKAPHGQVEIRASKRSWTSLVSASPTQIKKAPSMCCGAGRRWTRLDGLVVKGDSQEIVGGFLCPCGSEHNGSLVASKG